MKETKLLTDSKDDLIFAAKLIKSGEVVGVPTETVYGLGADALNPDGVGKIFKAKGRPGDNPLIVHICSINTVKILSDRVPKLFYKLADNFWPGPLTMIVPKSKAVPYKTSGGLDTVGIRMPSHPIMRKLISLSGPIAAPSANISGYPSPTTAYHVLSDMNGKIPAIIDGGECSFGIESTVISFEDEETVRILRPGSVTREMLEKVCRVVVDKAVIEGVSPGEKTLSPGMKYKHYSPKANVIIVKGEIDKFCDFIAENNNVNRLYCLVYDEDEKKKIPCNCLTYGKDSRRQAHNLFKRLRELDDMGAATIFVRPPSLDGEGLAVYNRLLRAAGFEVIHL